MPSEKHQSGYLVTPDDHSIYYEAQGNPQGIPVLVLHGGPGAGLSPRYSELFDLSAYYVIGFDQRGCGRSTPALTFNHNTSAHLVADIRLLQRTLCIDKWLLFGGSWGSTLALLSAIDNPDAVLGLVLRGIFLARQEDVEWFLDPRGGASQIYPEAFANFVAGIPKLTNHTDVLQHYQYQFCSTDLNRRNRAALRWYQWEEAISQLLPTTSPSDSITANNSMLSLALLEWFYISKQCFISENYILTHIDTIAHLPGILIHGRCDTVCKPQGAYALHQQWPNSELQLIAGAGHSSSEPGIRAALKKALDSFAAH